MSSGFHCHIVLYWRGKEAARVSKHSTWDSAIILQFPVRVLSGATWNCTPSKSHLASSAHLLLFHYSLYLSLLHSNYPSTTPAQCHDQFTESQYVFPGTSVIQAISWLAVCHTAHWFLSSHSCWMTHSVAWFDWTAYELFFLISLFLFSRTLTYMQK